MIWKELLNSQRYGATKSINFDPARSPFEMDYDRIIFSYPFRRLQDKTQVFPLPDHDFVHNRLTHSLEVSSVGRSLGKMVGEKILEREKDLALTAADFGSIVAAACLAHDIGNPPFGHSGEKAISEFFLNHVEGRIFQSKVAKTEWADLVSFEGNAQGLRLLCHAQNKGLRLTHATLAAFTKYPCQSSFEGKSKAKKSQKKFGFYQTEASIFREIAAATNLREEIENIAWVRHPLVYLVEAADDTCYHIIDLEDGCRLGWVRYEVARDLLAEIIGDAYKPEKLSDLETVEEKMATLRALAINILVGQLTKAFLDNEKEILDGTLNADLFSLVPCSATLKQISQLSVAQIYQSRQVIEKEAAGFQVISGLMEAFCSAAYKVHFDDNPGYRDQLVYKLMPSDILLGIHKSETTYQLLRTVLDFISGLTDGHALSLYRNLTGISLPGIRS
jgi:dGTPase